jgi:hypothetical protein
MKDSIEIFADLTVVRENREISIKADGKVVDLHIRNHSSIFKELRHVARLLGGANSLEKLDRVLSSIGLSVILHVGLFHIVVLGSGASRFIRYVLLFWGRFGRRE